MNGKVGGLGGHGYVCVCVCVRTSAVRKETYAFSPSLPVRPSAPGATEEPRISKAAAVQLEMIRGRMVFCGRNVSDPSSTFTTDNTTHCPHHTLAESHAPMTTTTNTQPSSHHHCQQSLVTNKSVMYYSPRMFDVRRKTITSTYYALTNPQRGSTVISHAGFTTRKAYRGSPRISSLGRRQHSHFVCHWPLRQNACRLQDHKEEESPSRIHQPTHQCSQASCDANIID